MAPDRRLLYPCFHGPEPMREEITGCYAARDGAFTSVQHVWLHRVSDVIGSLVRAGLTIESFDEYPFMAWRFFPWMERGDDGWWRLPAHPGVPTGPGEPAADVLAEGVAAARFRSPGGACRAIRAIALPGFRQLFRAGVDPSRAREAGASARRSR